MERTARDMIGTPLLQSHEVAHHINDLSRVENPVYRFLRYHLLLFVHLFVIHVLHLDHRILLNRSLLLRGLAYLIFVNGLLHPP